MPVCSWSIKLVIPRGHPYFLSRDQRHWLLTGSNAFLKSLNMIYKGLCCSADFSAAAKGWSSCWPLILSSRICTVILGELHPGWVSFGVGWLCCALFPWWTGVRCLNSCHKLECFLPSCRLGWYWHPWNPEGSSFPSICWLVRQTEYWGCHLHLFDRSLPESHACRGLYCLLGTSLQLLLHQEWKVTLYLTGWDVGGLFRELRD